MENAFSKTTWIKKKSAPIAIRCTCTAARKGLPSSKLSHLATFVIISMPTSTARATIKKDKNVLKIRFICVSPVFF